MRVRASCNPLRYYEVASSALPNDVPDLSGRIVADKFKVSRLIGTGGMGTVWEGFHTTLATRVAIKFIKPAYVENKEARARFEIEARAAARIRTKHAVHVYDYGVSDDGLPYIVMEYLEGESLSESIIRRGALTPAETAFIIGQAARALETAHASGVVHRDLKPDNIFLQKSDDPNDEYPYSIKLVDFGIAKMFDTPLEHGAKSHPMGGPTREGTVIGTPNFMAPEQLTMGGLPGPLTDIWSLGACTFAAVTARLPFEGDVLGDIVLKVCAEPMPVPSKYNTRLPPGFDAWFARACARDPMKRFQSAGEMADALAKVCGVVRVRTASMDDDKMQYVLRPRSLPDIVAAEELEVPRGMSPKSALLMGLFIGVAIMVGLVGFLAYRDKIAEEQSSQPSSSPSASAAPSASVDAGKKPE
jgi:serine/threonine-protein kinase